MTRSIGICTKRKSIETLDYEKYALVVESHNLFEQIILIDPLLITYEFIRGESKPTVKLNGQDISYLNALHVRSTTDRQVSTALLVHSLKLCGCDIFDPISRFSVGYASKLLTTCNRFEKGIGTSSFFAFTLDNAVQLVQSLDSKGFFPLLAKPVAGKKGKGIELLKNLEAATEYINHFFIKPEHQLEEPLFLQTYEIFVEEYRAIIVDGKVLGMVKKIPEKGKIVSNVAQGARFDVVSSSKLGVFLTENVSEEGVLGVDVGIDTTGAFHIIETNRAPMWQTFEEATGINVAQYIIRRTYERLVENDV